jgi:hypothetical protein
VTVHFQWGWSGFINFLEITIVSVLNGSNSEWKILNAAVLFLLFINDIVTDIKAGIKLFADDNIL